MLPSGVFTTRIDSTTEFLLTPPEGFLLRISSATFAPTVKIGEKSEATVTIDDDGVDYAFCRLSHATRFAQLDLMLLGGSKHVLKVIGNAAVDLVGYHTPNTWFDDEDDDDDDAAFPSITDDLDGDDEDSEAPAFASPFAPEGGATVEEIGAGGEESDGPGLPAEPPKKAQEPAESKAGKLGKKRGADGAVKGASGGGAEEKKEKAGKKQKQQAGAKPASKAGKAKGGDFKCDHCDKTFTNVASRSQHAKSKHKQAAGAGAVD